MGHRFAPTLFDLGIETSRPRLAIPEASLALSVIESAVDDLMLGRRADTPQARRLALDAWRWIAAEDDRGPFAFRFLCEVLGGDPDIVRGRLRREMGG